MQVFLVGGAVRDELLGVPFHERDWVITGATPEALIQLGYQQVGNDFPVFLHPQTREEYALARTERKQGLGYTGFVCDASSGISLEDDLIRRDLTINAIAKNSDGELIDPYGGQNDIESRVLRHVSDAFIEDPLRVLRVARFAARYHHLGFSIAPETQTLMQQMAKSGELTQLTPERVWKEIEKSLQTDNPHIFFEVLRECGALAETFPELDKLWGIPNPVKWHPEIDTGIHTMMVLQQACSLSTKLSVRFAALVHDLGKGETPSSQWPSHKGHETKGADIIAIVCQRLRIPNEYRDLASLVSRFHSKVHRITEQSADAILEMFDQCDLWRKPQRFTDFLTCCQADFSGRAGFDLRPYPQKRIVEECASQTRAVAVKTIIEKGFKGAEIKQELSRQRATIINTILSHYQPTQ